MVEHFWQQLCTNLKAYEILLNIGKIANGVRN